MPWYGWAMLAALVIGPFDALYLYIKAGRRRRRQMSEAGVAPLRADGAATRGDPAPSEDAPATRGNPAPSEDAPARRGASREGTCAASPAPPEDMRAGRAAPPER